MKKLLSLFVLIPLFVSAGIMEEIVFREDSFGSKLETSAVVLNKEQMLTFINSDLKTLPEKSETPSGAKELKYLVVSLKNPNDVSAWGTGRVWCQNPLVNEAFSFFVGMNNTCTLIIPLHSATTVPGIFIDSPKVRFEKVYRK